MKKILLFVHITLLLFSCSAKDSIDKNEELNQLLFKAIDDQLPVEEIGRLLAQGARVEADDDVYGLTVLSYACRAPIDIQVIRLLINSGADLNSNEPYGASPLSLAVYHQKNLHIIRLILDSGADVNAISSYDGGTALMTAVKYQKSPELIELLLDSGADASIIAFNGDSALSKIIYNSALTGTEVYYRIKDACLKDSEEDTLSYAVIEQRGPGIIGGFIAEGSDVNGRNQYGSTPLHFASIVSAAPEILHLLIEAGSDVNEKEVDGYTPLMYAARNGTNPELMNILIEAGARVNDIDSWGENALMIAAWNQKYPEILEFLVDAGSNIRISGEGGTVLDSLQRNEALFESAIYRKIEMLSTLVPTESEVQDTFMAIETMFYVISDAIVWYPIDGLEDSEEYDFFLYSETGNGFLNFENYQVDSFFVQMGEILNKEEYELHEINFQTISGSIICKGARFSSLDVTLSGGIIETLKIKKSMGEVVSVIVNGEDFSNIYDINLNY